MSSCAIVILNYNGRDTLETFLPSVVNWSGYTIWIIDNGSTDDSVNFLRLNFPAVQLLESAENLGYAGGYNWGLEKLKGQFDFYILLNSDVEVTKNWDKDLVHALDSQADYAAIQPKILSWASKKKFDYAGAGGGYLDDYGYPYCRGRIFEVIESDFGQYNDQVQVDWASGACFILRANVFHDLHGFDASFFAHMEEIDLCWRFRKSGWKIGYDGKIEVYHLGGGTLDRSSPKKLYLNIRNSLSMLYKLESNSSFRRIYRLKFVLEHLAGLSFLLKGQKEFAKAISKGYADFNQSRKSIRKFQTSISEDRQVRSKSPVQLVLWNWKILGKTRFSEL